MVAAAAKIADHSRSSKLPVLQYRSNDSCEESLQSSGVVPSQSGARISLDALVSKKSTSKSTGIG